MPSAGPREGSAVGDRFSDFTLKDLAGQAHSLKDLRGRRVVHVVFWASWCVPCLQEIPAIRQVYAKYRERGLEVLSIALNLNETPEVVRSLARDLKVTYPVLWDEDGMMMRRHKVYVVPQNFLIGKDGIIRYTGVNLPGNYEALVETLLREGGATATGH